MNHTRFISLVALCSIAAGFASGCSVESSPEDGTGGVGVTGNPTGTADGSNAAAGGSNAPTGDSNAAAGGSKATTGDNNAAMGGSSDGNSAATGGTSTATGGTGGSPMDAAGGSGGSSEPSAAGAGGSPPGAGGLSGDGGDGPNADPAGGGEGGDAGEGGANASAGGAGDPGMSSELSSGCGQEPGISSDMYNNGNPISITAADRQRRYILSVPDNYDNNTPYNLVIAWHQLDGNDKQMFDQNFYWLKDIPEVASSTIFVAPNGEKNGSPCTGNGIAEGGCGWPDSNGSNVALADAVVAEVTANFCINMTRIFANGWSYGGSMSYRTACSRPLGGGDADWGVRAVAVYNGAAQLSSGGCSPSEPVAFYASHGTNDSVLSYEGGVSMATTYAGLSGCMSETPARASGNHICTNFTGCMDDYPVEFCSFVGPHTPDPPREGGDRWQPQEVWNFFKDL